MKTPDVSSRSVFHSILLILLLAFLIPLGGCSRSRRVRIGVSQCSYDDWRVKLNEEMYRESLLHDNLDLEIRSAHDDPDRQILDIRHFIDEGVDVIIASPQNSDNLNNVLSEAREKGIIVIDFDRKPSAQCYDIFVGADNEQLGRSAGQYLISHLPKGARFLEIRGSRQSTPAGERGEGFRKLLSESPGSRLIDSADGDWNTPDARRVADSLLRLHPEANAIFAHNDRMAIGAAKAAHALGRDSILIAGIDAVPSTGIRAVADGLINVTFMYPTAGKELIDLGLRAASGKQISDEFLISSTQPIDGSNASILLELSQSIDDEKDKIGFLQRRIDEFSSRHHLQTYVIFGSLILLLIFAGGLFLILRAYWQRKRTQEELAERNAQLSHQRDELENLNTRLREATQSKLSFFTNVSHDLRTPLTLIAEPIASLADASNLTPDQRILVGLADKNILILRRLINQILDFRKYENGKLELNATEMPLPGSLVEWADAFRSLARRRHISYSVDFSGISVASMAADPEKMERIFFNLMSNAFKFTPDNGHISVEAATSEKEFSLVVADSGKGIPADELPHVFERFYQADRVLPQGSGIGLALVKAFVELHEGEVAVESTPGKGSTFRISIPIRHIASDPVHDTPPSSPASKDIPALNRGVLEASDVDRELGDIDDAELPDASAGENGRPTILVIDDTPDIRTLLRTLLAGEYNVVEAADGKQGIRLASKYIPDLIICDMMMPEMDGLECCRRIKEEISTSHIPILMLTACRLDEQRVDAYEAGADAYLSKPFSGAMLIARCRSLIANRLRISGRDLSDASIHSLQVKESCPKATAADTTSSSVESMKVKSVRRKDPSAVENEFYQRFLRIVDEEIGNPDISIEEIGNRLGLSRVQFYRKIKALTNFSPVELLRIRRLKEARRILTSSETTVAEVAYSVGFSSPGYFAKCFREQFGELPADLQRRTSKLK